MGPSIPRFFSRPSIQSRLQDTKASEEVRALETFYKMLKNEPAKAFYGPKHIAATIEAEAVETLLICDKLFRGRGVAERRKYVDMVDRVREVGRGRPLLLTLDYRSGERSASSPLCTCRASSWSS